LGTNLIVLGHETEDEMSQHKVARAGLFGLLLTSALLLLAGSAMAAGKPLVKTPTRAGFALSSVVPSGSVNPNGVATYGSFEYRLAGTEEAFTTTPSQYVGAGTEYVSITAAKVKGLIPASEYELRLTASNSYGATTSSALHFSTSTWYVEEGGDFASAFNSESTPASFEWPMGGYTVSFDCSERVHGTLGHGGWELAGGGKEVVVASGSPNEDSYVLSFEGCTMAYNGVVACSLPSFEIQLAGNFVASVYKHLNLTFPKGCESPFGHEATFVVKPFSAVGRGPTSFATKVPVELEGELGFGEWVGKMTVTNSWFLTGANIGYGFRTFR
jgi:hypothetical protein